jgi:hypothetical protein
MSPPGVLSLGSLFTGTGALDMAAETVLGPLRHAWVSDTKPAAQRFLTHRFPGAPRAPRERSPQRSAVDAR